MTRTKYSGDRILAILESFRPHALFRAMAATTENSPWHREPSVMHHTEMVVKEFIKATNAAVGTDGWTIHDHMAGMCCIWHDTGKPAAKVVKNTPERGDYFAFHGHELISARLFEDFYTANPEMAVAHDLQLGQDRTRIAAVEWMVLNHMPWASKKQDHLSKLWATANSFVGSVDAYGRALMADQCGRQADDQDKKLAEAEWWMREFKNTVVPLQPVTFAPISKVLYLPIGPSGAGKSTYFANTMHAREGKGVEVFSLDRLRHEWYDRVDYSIAYRMSTEDSKFSEKANARFMQLVKAETPEVYVDNTNLSPKRRAFYIAEARRRGYEVEAIVLLSSLISIVARQQTRTDKSVPYEAVKQQYMSMHMPSIGEVDRIVVV